MSTEQNKLGTMPIGRLLISMSIPMMISFFIQALYNMVDSMFVARISENALTAVSIAFPLQQIITAIGVGTGVAVNALVPRSTGQGQKDKALRIANVAVVLSFCYTILFMLVGVFGVRAYYTMQTERKLWRTAYSISPSSAWSAWARFSGRTLKSCWWLPATPSIL